MSAIWSESFDLTGTVSSVPPTRWTPVGTFSATSSTAMETGRNGSGKMWHMRQGNSIGWGGDSALGASYGPTLILGFAWKYALNGTTGQSIINLMDGQTYQMGLRHDSNFRLCVIRNNSVLATETNAVMVVGQWYYLELKVVLAGSSAGSYAVRRNGTVITGLPDTSSVTTITSANATASAIRIGRVFDAINPPEMYFDDMYLCDSTGTNTDFLGDVSVSGSLPNNNGNTSGWTRTGGSAGGNYTAVNEATPDSDTSYVSASAVSTEDTYTYPDLPSNAMSVLAVLGTPIARKSDPGARSISTRVRSGASEASAPISSALGLTYAGVQQTMDVNPVTSSSWLVSEFNSAEFGPVITA
jgi:hypothetical protein